MLSSSSLNCTTCTNKSYKLLSAPSVQPTASLARLRGAGVPVLGMWVYKGVAHGKLMCYDDAQAEERVYLWRDKT